MKLKKYDPKTVKVLSGDDYPRPTAIQMLLDPLKTERMRKEEEEERQRIRRQNTHRRMLQMAPDANNEPNGVHWSVRKANWDDRNLTWAEKRKKYGS